MRGLGARDLIEEEVWRSEKRCERWAWKPWAKESKVFRMAWIGFPDISTEPWRTANGEKPARI